MALSTSHSPLPIVSADHLTTLQQQSPSQSVNTNSSSPVPTTPSITKTAAAGAVPSDTLHRPKHRQSTLSTSSSRQNRGGLFTLAALARDKTTNAIASLSEPSVRPRLSSSSLYRSAQSSPTSPSNNSHNSKSTQSIDSQSSTLDLPRTTNTANSSAPTSSHLRTETATSSLTNRQSLLETNPPSQAYSNTASDTPPPITFVPQGNHSKMHQTSSRLLRMTNDDRPFTRVSIAGRYTCCMQTNSREGFQGSVCNIGCQPATRTTPCSINKDRAFIFVRGGYQQLGISEILSIQSHA